MYLDAFAHTYSSIFNMYSITSLLVAVFIMYLHICVYILKSEQMDKLEMIALATIYFGEHLTCRK